MKDKENIDHDVENLHLLMVVDKHYIQNMIYDIFFYHIVYIYHLIKHI